MEREPTFDLHKPKIEMPIFQTIWSERLDEIKQDILDHKKEFSETTPDDNVFASWRSNWILHKTDPRFKPVSDFFEQFAQEIGESYFLTNEIYETVDMWAMTYDGKQGARPHYHYPSTLSFVFYIDVEEDSAPICFGENCRSVQNGLVLAFPSTCIHWVPDDYKGKRICISANLDHVTHYGKRTYI